jgi:hypothetical protein
VQWQATQDSSGFCFSAVAGAQVLPIVMSRYSRNKEHQADWTDKHTQNVTAFASPLQATLAVGQEYASARLQKFWRHTYTQCMGRHDVATKAAVTSA